MHSPHLLNDSIGSGTTIKYTVLVVLVHNVIMFGYHLYGALGRNKSSRLYNTLSIEWLSVFSLFNMLILSAYATFIVFPCYPSSWCNWVLNISVIIYTCSKVSTYIFFLERLFIIINSIQTLIPAQITTCQMQILRIFIVLWGLFATISTCVSGNGYYSIDQAMCMYNYPTFIPIFVILGDCSIGTMICIILSRTLISIPSLSCNNSNKISEISSKTGNTTAFETINIEHTNVSVQMNEVDQSEEWISENSKNNNASLIILLKRFAWLSFIALFSTQFNLLMCVILGLGMLWIVLDSVINAWCVLFTFTQNNKCYGIIYNKLLMNICMGYKCLLCYSCNCFCKVNKIILKNAKTAQNQINDAEIKMHLPKLTRDLSILDPSNTRGHIAILK
eukprot:139989_1